MVARSAASTKTTTSTSTSTSTPTGAGFHGSNKRFKGVRMRSWGKWVSEIRLPNTRARLWLGSYSTADQAARAFDVAMVCLRGRSAALNFPDSPPSYAPLGLPHHQIQELAASAAASCSPSFATSSPLVPSVDSRVNSDREPTAAAASSSPSSATSSSSPVPTVDPRLNSDREPISAASHESEADTTDDMRQSSWLSSTSAVSATAPQCSSRSSTSGGSDESEAATTNEMNSSCSCSSPLSTAHTLEDLLLLDDEDDEQSSSSLTSSPLAALQQEQTLHNMGVRWEWEEELLWGCGSVSSSYSLWDLPAFPPLPADDDLTAMVEPCLWSL